MNEEELIRKIKNGDRLAMDMLIEAYYQSVFSYFYRSTGDYHQSKDLAQEVFIKIMVNIGRYQIKTAMSYFSPLVIMIVLAPVPFLAFVIDILHYRNPNVVELEMTCRYDVRQLYVAKLLLGMLFNIILMFPVAFAASSVYADGWRLTFCTFTTMFFIGFIALLLMGRTKSSLPLSVFLALWVITGGISLRLGELSALLEKISIATFAIAFGTSLILFLMKLIYTGQSMRLCAENGG